jgi:hypothetical protein
MRILFNTTLEGTVISKQFCLTVPNKEEALLLDNVEFLANK